jgi:lambda family phage minor tail protein L
MAGEGANKVAQSLLDLQPTAILELFTFLPDPLNEPTRTFNFHGGTLYDKSLTWQGVKYTPLAVETDGFDLLADGQLARPKIKVTNENNIITSQLQLFQDFINAKIIRKRVSVKFLDDTNFDGGNPFGIADPTAELTNQTWLIGRKLQESKLFVEFELNSPLDLENFTVNSRGVVAKFCYWQYRGEGCRYEGYPIEKEDGSAFKNVDGDSVPPNWPSSYSDVNSPVDFLNYPDAEWNSLRNYQAGDIAFIQSPTIVVGSRNGVPQPLKTAYVCVSGNSGQSPEGNPSFWQKDGCTKKFAACKKRFNSASELSFIRGQNITTGFSGVRFSGATSVDGYAGPINSGLLHTTEPKITGALTGDFTIVGWASMNQNSPYGAGLFSTSERDADLWPACKYINIAAGGDSADRNIKVFYQGTRLNSLNDAATDSRGNTLNTYNADLITQMQGIAGINREWNRYIISHTTGVQNVIDKVNGDPSIAADVAARTETSSLSVSANIGGAPTTTIVNHNLVNGNFARLQKVDNAPRNGGRIELNRSQAGGFTDRRALPLYFRLGGIEQYLEANGYEDQDDSYISTMNGCIGPWAIWNRRLTQEELTYLHKTVRTPNESLVTNNFDKVPRGYYECTGSFSSITGDSLIAWWDGSTGNSSIGNGLLDIHGLATGTAGFGLHLTGSGQFSAIRETYKEAPVKLLQNPTPPFPRFGGFPGTDGFSYGRDTTIY